MHIHYVPTWFFLFFKHLKHFANEEI